MTDKELEKLVKKNFPNSYSDFIKMRNTKNNGEKSLKYNFKRINKSSKSKKRKNKMEIYFLLFKRLFILFVAVFMLLFSIWLFNDSMKITICLDAGHGGNDTGALSNDNNRYEKVDNLNLTLLVKEKLMQLLKENKLSDKYKIILTRDDDNYISLQERCDIANKKKSIMFISMHRNCLPKQLGEAQGIEVWINDYENESEKSLANNILNYLSECPISENRGIKYGTSGGDKGNYYVNEHTNMKSIIIETGFISNDYDNLLYDKHIDEYALAIAKGIFKEINK